MITDDLEALDSNDPGVIRLYNKYINLWQAESLRRLCEAGEMLDGRAPTDSNR